MDAYWNHCHGNIGVSRVLFCNYPNIPDCGARIKYFLDIEYFLLNIKSEKQY